MIVENYPQLKSNENFLRLQDELAGTENRIAVERKRYNDTLQDYNTYVQQFPDSLFAGWAGFKTNDAYFKAAEGSREVPKVNFNSPTTQAPAPEPAPAHYWDRNHRGAGPIGPGSGRMCSGARALASCGGSRRSPVHEDRIYTRRLSVLFSAAAGAFSDDFHLKSQSAASPAKHS